MSTSIYAPDYLRSKDDKQLHSIADMCEKQVNTIISLRSLLDQANAKIKELQKENELLKSTRTIGKCNICGNVWPDISQTDYINIKCYRDLEEKLRVTTKALKQYSDADECLCEELEDIDCFKCDAENAIGEPKENDKESK